MSIQNQITSDITIALKARDALRLEVLRSIKTAFTNELVSLKRTPQAELTDAESLNVIKRLAKQRQDAYEQFSQAGRSDLADKEQAEKLIIDEYLPTQLNDKELQLVVDEVLSDNPESDSSKIGILIGQVMKRVGDRATGDRVKKVLEESLK